MHARLSILALAGTLSAFLLAPALCAQSAPAAPAPATPATPVLSDPSYHIANGDSVQVTVLDEPDMSSALKVDADGRIRLPILGDFKIAGLTIREAENTLEKLYVEKELLRTPQVNISMVNYVMREVSVLGYVGRPGPFQLPPEMTSINLVELVTKVGGFTPDAKSDAVQIFRAAGGSEVVDAQALLQGKQLKDGRRQVLIYPGDRINVDRRVF